MNAIHCDKIPYKIHNHSGIDTWQEQVNESYETYKEEKEKCTSVWDTSNKGSIQEMRRFPIIYWDWLFLI